MKTDEVFGQDNYSYDNTLVRVVEGAPCRI